MGEQGHGGHRARRKLLWLGGLGAVVGLARGATPGAAAGVGVILVGNPGTPGAGAGSPRGGPTPAQLLRVERKPGTGFVVHMTDKVVNQTPFTYLITETYT
jgi:hypothetical protein